MRGAKPGERRGGRQKGTPNKAKVDADAVLAEATARATADLTPDQVAAMTPLDVMLHVMKIEAMAGAWKTAAMFAEKAAPYIHPKLASTVVDASVSVLDGLSLHELRQAEALLVVAARGGEGDELETKH